MKSISLPFATFLIAGALALAHSRATASDMFKTLAVEIPAPIERIFVPQGFDTNDNAEIVIAGTFPNSCYKMGKTTQYFNQADKKIYVDITAYHIKSDFCLTINIPFIQVIQLGMLSPSKHPISVNKILRSEIPIAQASIDEDRRDDHLYASVYGLIQKGPRTFEMQGVSPNHCYEILEVKIKIESKDVVAVSPIMEKAEGCDEATDTKAVAWIKSFDIPEAMVGKTLIHVRTLNGGSINQVVDLR